MKNLARVMQKKRLLIVPAALFMLAHCAAERLSVSCLIDLDAPERSYLSWTADGKTTRDSFDSVSGASKKHATKEFRAVAAKDGKSRLPRGVLNLFLFAVSAPELARTDALTFSKRGNAVAIQFVHRGSAYRIESDRTGAIDLYTGCFVHPLVAENKGGSFTVREAFLKPGGDAGDFRSVDWDALDLSADTPETERGQNFSGVLRATVAGNALKINGTLLQSDNTVKSREPSPNQSLFGMIAEKIQGFSRTAQKKPPARTEVAADEPWPEEEAEEPSEADRRGQEADEPPHGEPGEIDEGKIDDLLRKLDSI